MTTNQVHFTRGGRFICLGATSISAKTTECARVTCQSCLRTLIRDAVSGTKLAAKLSMQLHNVKKVAV